MPILAVQPPGDGFYDTCPKDPAVAPVYGPAGATGGAAGFYKPADGAELVAALDSIFTNARTCTFRLQATVSTGNEHRGTVRLDGKPLVYDDPDGFRLPDPQTIEVLGAACHDVKSTAHLLEVSFPCDAVILR